MLDLEVIDEPAVAAAVLDPFGQDPGGAGRARVRLDPRGGPRCITPKGQLHLRALGSTASSSWWRERPSAGSYRTGDGRLGPVLRRSPPTCSATARLGPSANRCALDQYLIAVAARDGPRGRRPGSTEDRARQSGDVGDRHRDPGASAATAPPVTAGWVTLSPPSPHATTSEAAPHCRWHRLVVAAPSRPTPASLRRKRPDLCPTTARSSSRIEVPWYAKEVWQAIATVQASPLVRCLHGRGTRRRSGRTPRSGLVPKCRSPGASRLGAPVPGGLRGSGRRARAGTSSGWSRARDCGSCIVRLVKYRLRNRRRVGCTVRRP